MRGHTSREPDPRWSAACHGARPETIAARDDAANKLVGRQKAHYARVKDAIRRVIVEGESPIIISDVAARAISEGLPVHPHVLHAPEAVLAYEVRYLCLAIPSLSGLHGDARGWLANKLKRRPEDIEPGIPWNLLLAGQAIDGGGG